MLLQCKCLPGAREPHSCTAFVHRRIQWQQGVPVCRSRCSPANSPHFGHDEPDTIPPDAMPLCATIHVIAGEVALMLVAPAPVAAAALAGASPPPSPSYNEVAAGLPNR